MGLGAMGSAISRRLLSTDHELTVWNRTREKAEPLLREGARWAESPRELAARSEIVFTMVTDTAAVKAVCEGPDGLLAGLGPGKVYVDMSTGSPVNTRALADSVAGVAAQMLDAPVSGTPPTVEQGRASLMVGGDEDAFERVRPVLEDLPQAVPVGGQDVDQQPQAERPEQQPPHPGAAARGRGRPRGGRGREPCRGVGAHARAPADAATRPR